MAPTCRRCGCPGRASAQEYLAAFARGARGVELDQILRRHKVPTPRQLPARDGKARYSSLRDTTWDQLPPEAGAVRAMRWMTYSGRPVRAVPIDATPEQRARIEHENALALRKLELLRSGQYLYHYANPTPTEDAYGKHVVVRSGPLDPGWIPATITFDWPAKRKLVLGPDGVLVTSDEIELDDDGQPVPWERLGVPITVLDDCIARLASQAVEGPATDKEAGAGNRMVRALRIQRWTSNEDDGEVRQWEAFNHWTADAKEVCPDGLFYRWILWRPAPCPQVPAQHLNLGWGAVEADVRRPASPSSTRASERKTKPDAYADHPERHVGTLREYRIVAWLAEALRNDLLDVLDQDLVVSAALLGDRARDAEARHRRLLDQASTARDRADAAKLTANGYEEAAMLDLGSGDRDGYSKKLAKAKAKAEEADGLNAEAERLEAAASEEPVVEAELPVRRLAQLIEILARAGTRELEGRVPAAIAVITHEMFTGWQFRPGPPRKLEVSCTARIPLADGTIIERRLCGLVDNTRKGQRGEDPYGAAVLHDLETGKGFEEIAATSTRPTSRSALYCQARERLKQLSPDASVATCMIHPLLDHPHPLALPAVIAALTGDASEQSLWTPGFERHMGRTYRTGTWGKSACPTTKMEMIHRVFAAVRQCPGGARIHDVAAAADVPVDFVKRLVTPLPTTEGSGSHRRWPKFLCWVSGRVGIEVRAHACPHDDCRAPAGRRWATDPVFLPETAPKPGDIGGVLCPACHRLPDKAYGDIYFPAAWHQPVARVTDGNRGSLRSQQLTRPIAVGRVGGVAAPPATLKLDELAVEFGLGRKLLADILLRHRVPYETFATGGGGGEGTRLYAAKPARAAVSLAFTSNTV